MHREIIDTLIAKHHDILQTAIPYASDIERMGLERKPLGAYLKRGRCTEAYQQLWQELLARIK